MRIRLTQIDGKLPSLALMKLAHYHRARGDEVRFSKHVERQRGEQIYDRIHGSAIFSFLADRVAQFRQHFPDAIVGGTHDTSDHYRVVLKRDGDEFEIGSIDVQHGGAWRWGIDTQRAS